MNIQAIDQDKTMVDKFNKHFVKIGRYTYDDDDSEEINEEVKNEDIEKLVLHNTTTEAVTNR